MNITTWTPELTTALIMGAAAGKTAAEIGAEIGYSRSAVLGKASRIGVSFPLTEDKEARRRERVSATMRRQRAKPPAGWAGYRSRPRGASAFQPSERLLAISLHLGGLSQNRAAKEIGASAATVKNWMADEELVAKARDLVFHAREEARATARKRAEAMANRSQQVMAWNEGVLRTFGDRNADVIRRRLNGEPLAVIARDYGITRERARQILMKGVKVGIKAPPGLRLLNDRATPA